MIKIAIAEDNPIALKALKQKLDLYADICIVHTCNNGQELTYTLEKDNNIDVILMDIEMPKMNGIEATSIVRQNFPNIKIIMITVYDDDHNIFNAILAGANSYILKETKAEKVYDAIIDTIQGGAVMSPSIALKTIQLLKSNTNQESKNTITEEPVNLSDRELEILIELSNGLTNKHIADKLFISPFTVKRHVENIYLKLQINNRIALINTAKNKGLI